MKKWFKFFSLSFFSHKWAKEGARRGYGNSFLGFILALIFLWVSFIGAEMLPFSSNYKNSPDFRESVYSVFANADLDLRIDAEFENGALKLIKHGGEFAEELLVNTFENELDRQNYSKNGYHVIVDTRSADTLAEFEAYCISNDGKEMVITYDEYLTLSEVARLNFDFRLRYTGNALELTDELVGSYKQYLEGTSEENRLEVEKLASDLDDGAITKEEYARAIYELYFVNYYPAITDYEATSKVPLLRNYYYHQYIKEGNDKYLFVFDDYMAGCFETKSGRQVAFYGFYDNMENGSLIVDGASQEEAKSLVDGFMKDSYRAIWILNVYAYAMNIFSLIPFIALMLLVAALLTYSVLKLRYVDSITSLGGMFKIVGSFASASGVIAAILTVMLAFFAPREIVNVLPLVLFFAVLVVRSVAFAIKESKLYKQQLEQEESE
ncbi:MAG: hypothetical protein IKA84_01950 [Clostridia bacterium]|nr:hypothetical protein [Clostridia bacterium]